MVLYIRLPNCSTEVPIYKESSTNYENITFTTSLPALGFIKIILMFSLLI